MKPKKENKKIKSFRDRDSDLLKEKLQRDWNFPDSF